MYNGFVMDQIIPISQARSQLPQLVDQISNLPKRVLITVKGKVKAALVNAEEYDSMAATLEILSDKKAMKAIRQGEKEIKAGQTVAWEDIKKELDLEE
jgi:prevent-host-death family protein